MSTTPATTPESISDTVSDTTASHLHSPTQKLLDSLDVAACDEVQHEAALRDSALRPPR
ncbi:MAG: hypothetical protein WA777_08755 [Rhodanobacter sp.]